ncbi:sulfotransferase [Pseudidiomarina sp. 1ASP75-14]|uniref:tetratricopeptide repeat-containing sulfotransferase family protein n=1 Tax=Pseudidiomarina terrestris TaxID=2820060 RepID=UPI00264A5C48|nr:sulfotransferase [Pseudidiomarina sp. 1ASP75-14]MDN7136735.1 sulfotransferase [Pseudidiomarina sp. 1ASP75-14]
MNSAGKSKADAALRATERGDYTQALNLYAEAVHMTPRHPVLLYNYASLARITGDLDLALTLLNQVIDLNPDDTAAWHMRSNLRRWTPEHNHIAALTKKGQPLHSDDTSASKGSPKPLSPKQQVELNYALAKEHEDCGNYAEARQHLLCAAALRRQHLNYNIQDDLDTIAALSKKGQPLDFKEASKRKGCPSSKCVFVLGLPRVGSTLLERMLSCDKRVVAAGELPFFPQLLGRALQSAFIKQNGPHARPKSKTELVSYVDNVDWQKLGADYLAQLPEGEFVIDKLPLNFLNIGLIQRALPHAKVIYMHRDQQDHELALMKHLFNQAYPWSYSLAEIRQYYEAATALCERACAQSPKTIHKVSYEDLVGTPEQTLKEVSDYCGLNWQQKDLRQALQFASHNQKASTTGSASQVRSQLHQRSVGLAKKYGWPATDLSATQLSPPFATR